MGEQSHLFYMGPPELSLRACLLLTWCTLLTNWTINYEGKATECGGRGKKKYPEAAFSFQHSSSQECATLYADAQSLNLQAILGPTLSLQVLLILPP